MYIYLYMYVYISALEAQRMCRLYVQFSQLPAKLLALLKQVCARSSVCVCAHTHRHTHVCVRACVRVLQL